MALKIGERIRVKSVDGPLNLTGTIYRQGPLSYFISDETNGLHGRPWTFRIDLEKEIILWLNGRVDDSMEIIKLGLPEGLFT